MKHPVAYTNTELGQLIAQWAEGYLAEREGVFCHGQIHLMLDQTVLVETIEREVVGDLVASFGQEKGWANACALIADGMVMDGHITPDGVVLLDSLHLGYCELLSQMMEEERGPGPAVLADLAGGDL
ncbi:hypothetical protein [Aeromonas veronii]|uniref:hypothetical protein n=1 Tax=Aeromonas veronii TaxID=654 RepID=UPI003D228CF6